MSGVLDSGSRQPIVGQPDETFQLGTPDTTLKQGETRTVTISIKRSLNFNEDVTLKLGDLPRGLSVDNTRPEIKHGDSEVSLVLTAAPDASLGDFSVKVTGHPTRGGDATNDLKITVAKK